MAYQLLGQAKLIASFPFQDFQNMMRAGDHYSLQLRNSITAISRSHAVVINTIYYYNEILKHYQKSMQAEREFNNQLCVALLFIIVCIQIIIVS